MFLKVSAALASKCETNITLPSNQNHNRNKIRISKWYPYPYSLQLTILVHYIHYMGVQTTKAA